MSGPAPGGTSLAFIDTETTGLDPDRHDIWEIGLIVRSHRVPDRDGEWHWQLQPDLAKADPSGLRVGRFYERIHSDISIVHWRGKQLSAPPEYDDKVMRANSPSDIAHRLANLLDGAHMVGAVPSFDAAFLTRFLRQHGQCPTWHYHLIDVEALAAGWVAGTVAEAQAARQARGDDRPVGGSADPHPPWDTDALSEAVGAVLEPADRHTALGDARWAMAVYDAVMGTGGGEP